MTELKVLVEKFQCPGCVAGGNTECGSYKPNEGAGSSCKSQVLGTFIGGVGHIALGLPKGFCRSGVCPDSNPSMTHNHLPIRLWQAGTYPEWDVWNVAVWAKIEDGFLFVRTYMPRRNEAFMDVIEGGTLALVPNVLDVTDLDMD